MFSSLGSKLKKCSCASLRQRKRKATSSTFCKWRADKHTKACATSHMRVVRALAALNQRLDVDAGELQTLARVDEAREFEEATVVAVRVVGVLKKRIAIASMFARSSSVYLRVGACVSGRVSPHIPAMLMTQAAPTNTRCTFVACPSLVCSQSDEIACLGFYRARERT